MKKIISLVLSIAMLLSFCSVVSFAEEGNDYDCIDGYAHTTNNGACGNCSAFILEEGATIYLETTLNGLYNTRWELAEGHAIIIDSGSSSHINLVSSVFATYPWVEIAGITAGTDVLLLYADDSAYLAAKIVVIPHQTHITFETINGMPATCTESGLTDGKKCAYCGEVTIAQQVIPATGHSVVSMDMSATCTSPGYSGGEQCAVCGEIFVEPTEIPATGHTYTAVVTEPTCIEQGYTIYTCFCGDLYIGDYVDATGHSYTAEIIEPTCTEDGYTTYSCFCGDVYISDYVDATGHTYTAEIIEPTCTDDGYTTYTCYCGDCYISDYVDATGHIDTIEIIEPTCTEQGYTKYTCFCGDVYIDEYIDATGHNFTSKITDPTCAEKGYTTYTCFCGYSYSDNYTAKLSHDYSFSEVINPSCDTMGYTIHKCVCGDNYVDTYVAAACYNEEIFEEKLPTCTEAGMTEGRRCLDCNRITKEQKEIPATGHTIGDWEPGFSDDGEKVIEIRKCTVCGVKVEERDIAKGDINGDGNINAADARLALRFSARLETLTEEQQIVADVNNDNKITAADARIILRVSAKLETL